MSMIWYKTLYCRVFQTGLRAALPLLPYRDPAILDRTEQVAELLREKRICRPLLITDRNLVALGLTKPLQNSLAAAGIDYVVFDETCPNPTTALVEAAASLYRERDCDALIAFGGGSPMDLAKAAGARLVRPQKPLPSMAGILKVRKRLPLLVAIPTTAGTGSETTLAAVITDSETRHKFAINDFPLIPSYAVLDARVIHTLPRAVAAATGIDALTHAVEAYIGRSTTRQTRADAEEAVRLIFANLRDAAEHKSEQAERAMLYAAYYAGRAFTRSYVGYIHAVSHSLSGRYDMPHGLTNAILLPRILRRYGAAIHRRLARLAVCAGLGKDGEDATQLAERFIHAVEELNASFDIPTTIAGIRETDIPLLAEQADREAHPLYPVPVLWSRSELADIYREVKE